MSSSSIMAEIREVEKELQKNKELLIRYEKLLSDVTNTMPHLCTATVELTAASNNIGSFFTIEEQRADKETIERKKELVEDEKDKISGEVIPEIKRKIEELKRKIEQLKVELRGLERALKDAQEAEREKEGENTSSLAGTKK